MILKDLYSNNEMYKLSFIRYSAILQSLYLMISSELPTTIALSCTSLASTAPAPIVTLFPTFTDPMILYLLQLKYYHL